MGAILVKKDNTRLQDLIFELKRKEILDAAAGLFAERGFQRATMRAVASRAGIATGTIYNFYDDKDALLRALMHRLNESERRSADLAAAGSNPASYIRHRLELATAELPLLQVILAEALVDPAVRQSYLEEIIAPTFALAEKQLRRQGRGNRTEALRLRIVAATLVGLLVLRILGEPKTVKGWNLLPQMLADLFFGKGEQS
jgi:AcrR family transcriptional regulator